MALKVTEKEPSDDHHIVPFSGHSRKWKETGPQKEESSFHEKGYTGTSFPLIYFPFLCTKSQDSFILSIQWQIEEQDQCQANRNQGVIWTKFTRIFVKNFFTLNSFPKGMKVGKSWEGQKELLRREGEERKRERNEGREGEEKSSRLNTIPILRSLYRWRYYNIRSESKRKLWCKFHPLMSIVICIGPCLCIEEPSLRTIFLTFKSCLRFHSCQITKS